MQSIGVTGHHQSHEFPGTFVRRFFIDVDGIHITGKDVSNGADDHVALFVDIDRCRVFFDTAGDDLPQTRQVSQVAREFSFGLIDTGGSHDESQPLGWRQFVQDAT